MCIHEHITLGAVHILRQPKSGVPGHPLRQLSSAFARRPFRTTIFDVDFFACYMALINMNV